MKGGGQGPGEIFLRGFILLCFLCFFFMCVTVMVVNEVQLVLSSGTDTEYGLKGVGDSQFLN